MSILFTQDALKNLDISNYGDRFDIVPSVSWEDFVHESIPNTDGEDMILAFKEFIYLMKEGVLRPILGYSGLNENVCRYYDSCLFYFTNVDEVDDKSYHNTQLPVLKKDYSEIIEFGYSITLSDLFIIANIMAVYYLSRQLAQSDGFISDERNNIDRNYFSSTPRYCKSTEDANRIFLYPEDENNQNARIYNRFYGIENVDNTNLLSKHTHVIYYFLEKLVQNPDKNTPNFIRFDSDSGGLYKKDDIVSFCKLFNPNIHVSHYFNNNGTNLLSSIKNLVKKSITSPYVKEKEIEQIALTYIERIQDLKYKVLRWYTLLFYRVLTNSKNIEIPTSDIKSVYGADVVKSFLGLNFFGNFFYAFNINYERRKLSEKTTVLYKNIKKEKSLYLYVLGYDITDFDTSTLYVSFVRNQIVYCIEFEGNVITNYGIRPVLKVPSNTANSYYTTPQEYTGSIQRNFTTTLVSSMEKVMPQDVRVNFYASNTNANIACFERDRLRLSFPQPVSEIKIQFVTEKSTLFGLFFLL